jgi:hypothetical protein
MRGKLKPSLTAATGWKRKFDEPIPVPKGKPLHTLKDAAAYILKLRKAEQSKLCWQTAAEAVIMAAER